MIAPESPMSAAGPGSRWWPGRAVVGLAFAALGLLLYSGALTAGFVADDFVLLQAVRDGGPLGVWTDHSFGWLRPVASLSLYLDYRIWGTSPFGFHLTNIGVHVVNAVLVAAVASLLLERTELEPGTAGGAAFLAGLLFLVLPSHAESVAWIAGRTDVIAALFCLCAFLFYLRFKRQPGTRDAILAVAAFGAALFAKESALTLPLVVASYEALDQWLGRRPEGPSDRAPAAAPIRGTAPATRLVISLLALVPIYFLLRRTLTGDVVAGYGSGIHLAPLVKPTLFAWLPIFWVRTLWPCCWPADQLPASLSLAERITAMQAFYLGVALLGALGFGWSVRRRASRNSPGPGEQPGRADLSREPLRGWRRSMGMRIDRVGALLLWLPLAFCLAQLPAVGIGMNVESTLGERFTYIPSAFAAIFVALCLTLWFRAPHGRAVAAAGLILVYALLLARANTRWRQAGALARGILASVEPVQDPEQSVVVLTLPDNLNGALVFRSGLGEALALQGKVQDPGQVQVLSHLSLHAVDDRVDARRRDGSVVLRPANGRAAFSSSSAVPLPEGVTVSIDAEGLLRVELDPLLAPSLDSPESNIRYVYYSAGRLLALPED